MSFYDPFQPEYERLSVLRCSIDMKIAIRFTANRLHSIFTLISIELHHQKYYAPNAIRSIYDSTFRFLLPSRS